ncbi:hypothetical protein TRFO_23436 [Tritrichomonas foetus]|uniref:Proteasome assembly chaperone 1 n=1 Tax=Tritrichomonas foetus TaxID=1144522 RepID=A0A1J4KB66_9EUKA|nr:hypothetical protein TRFO_23436 [Tritrichomonas foetus]|eukprot:OHT08152.1 hypothetical protein TRFO_23436 [Tritrichomonas foetus]
MKQIWDASALSEVDKTVTKVKYEGSEIKANHFVLATSPSSFALINSITEKVKPSGAFVLDIYDLEDSCQYANGDDTPLHHFKTIKNSVYLINDTCLIAFEHIDGCQHEIVKLFYETFKPTNLLILNSMHRSLYHGETDTPALYILSEMESDSPKLALPNIVCGIASGFLSYAKLFNAKCQILQVIEEDYGASASSIRLWAEKLLPILELNVDQVSANAVKKYSLRSNDMGLLYT